MDKLQLVQCLTEAEDILNQNELEYDILRPRFLSQKNDIESFTAKILFVGAFSAGKSALINSLLGDEEILKENISPQTALPAELIYSPCETVEIVRQNGEIDSCDIADAENFSVEEYSKYIYRLNRLALKNLNDLILVDMPGFDSGIEAHNKALMQYIEDAAAYIFVIDLEKGTVGKSSLDFLTEINQYCESIAFVLTKHDKLLPSDAEKVTAGITSTLESITGKEPRLIVTSAREADCGEKLGALLANFSADELLLQKFAGKTVNLLGQAVQTMKMQLSAVDFNSHDLDLAIQNQERQKESLIVASKREKKKLHDELQFDVSDKILHDVESALRSQSDTLANAVQQGSDAFKNAVNNIVRPILIQSAQKNIDISFGNYLEKIVSSQDKQLNLDGAKTKLRQSTDALGKLSKGFKIFSEVKKYKQLYQIFSTGLAVATNFVAPLLELIIIFLPDIISVLNNFIGQSQSEKIKNRIESEVIPQICEKLRPNIRETLLQVEQERFAEIDEELKVALDSEIAALQQLKDEKSQRQINVEQKKAALSAGINRIEELINFIEKA